MDLSPAPAPRVNPMVLSRCRLSMLFQELGAPVAESEEAASSAEDVHAALTMIMAVPLADLADDWIVVPHEQTAFAGAAADLAASASSGSAAWRTPSPPRAAAGGAASDSTASLSTGLAAWHTPSPPQVSAVGAATDAEASASNDFTARRIASPSRRSYGDAEGGPDPRVDGVSPASRTTAGGPTGLNPEWAEVARQSTADGGRGPAPGRATTSLAEATAARGRFANPWNEFQSRLAGSGLSMPARRRLYQEERLARARTLPPREPEHEPA